MAKFTVKNEVVKKTVVVEEVVPTFILELSAAEIVLVKTLVGNTQVYNLPSGILCNLYETIGNEIPDVYCGESTFSKSQGDKFNKAVDKLKSGFAAKQEN